MSAAVSTIIFTRRSVCAVCAREVDVTLLHRGAFGDLAVCLSCGQLHNVRDDLTLEAKHDYAGLTMDEEAEVAELRGMVAGALARRWVRQHTDDLVAAAAAIALLVIAFYV